MESTAAFTRYIPELDSLRAFAVLAVILFHLYVLPIGWMGVPLFFVLSGFLITRILLTQRHEKLGTYLANFYWRRTLRIFPLYYAFLAFNAFTLLRHSGSIADYGWLVTYLGNYKVGLSPGGIRAGNTLHLWSLAVEEQFYLLWPLIVYAFARRMVAVCVATIALSYVSRIAIYHFTGNPYLTILALPSCMDMLAAGALAAVVSDRRVLFAMGAVGMALTVAAFTRVGYANFGTPTGWVPLANFTYTGLALLFAPLMRLAPSLHFLNWSASRYVGRISYGIYIWHIFALEVAHRLIGEQPGRVLLLILTVILSVVIASTSWHFFERPILRYKDRRPSSFREAATALQP